MSNIKGESEEEELRRLERNRVAFEAWLEKKKEAKKKQTVKERAAERELAMSRSQQREAGRLAFQHWLKAKQDEDVIRKKQQAYLNEVEKLQQQSKAEERKRAKERFEMWRTQKDYELQLHRENEREMHNTMAARSTPSREPTPSLPGYVSVWSCDNELADFMVDKVDRGSHLLSHTPTHHTVT